MRSQVLVYLSLRFWMGLWVFSRAEDNLSFPESMPVPVDEMDMEIKENKNNKNIEYKTWNTDTQKRASDHLGRRPLSWALHINCAHGGRDGKGLCVGMQEFDEVQSEGNPACRAGDAEGWDWWGELGPFNEKFTPYIRTVVMKGDIGMYWLFYCEL